MNYPLFDCHSPDTEQWFFFFWRGVDLFDLYCQIITHYWRNSNKHQPGGRSWCWDLIGVWLTGLLPMACCAYFLMESKITSTGEVPPTIDCALLNQLLIKKFPFKPVYNLILLKHFLIWHTLFSNNSSLYHVNIKLGSTVAKCSLNIISDAYF